MTVIQGLLLTVFWPTMLLAQLGAEAASLGTDASYEQRYAELKRLEALPNRVATVTGLVFHGEAFPGMVHLSWSTFHQTDQQGEDELFRAHEVAHQWWASGWTLSATGGIDVRAAIRWPAPPSASYLS